MSVNMTTTLSLFIALVCYTAAPTQGLLRGKLFETLPHRNYSQDDVGKPLFLTPFLQNDEVEMAKNYSRVRGLPGAETLESYSGYLTVNEEFNSNLFFWFFPSETNKSAPVLLWLQGGPGGSSMFGLFSELGPLVATKDGNVLRREYSWTREFNVLFIDNPVGTGFSFTDDDRGYTTNQTEVARDLFEALTQFFTIFNEYFKNEFYATGESYAGKYVPAIGHRISIETKPLKFNFKGVAIGDGLCDPETQSDYASMLYQIGLMDESEAKHMTEEQNKAVKAIQEGRFTDAFRIFDEILNGDLISGKSYFKNATGLSDYYNFLNTEPPVEQGYYNLYIARPEVRKAIHVGNLTFNDGKKVEEHLVNDVMQSVKPWVGGLMEKYKVLLYSGQLDIIVAAPLTEKFINTIQWSGAEKYKKTRKQVWKVDPSDQQVAGYIRKVEGTGFVQAIIRNGGHILPYDQPRASFYMISNFINDRF